MQHGEAGAEGRRRSPLSPCGPHERARQRRPAARLAPVPELGQRRLAPRRGPASAGSRGVPRAHAARDSSWRGDDVAREPHRHGGRRRAVAADPRRPPTAAGARPARPARGHAPRPRPARHGPRRAASAIAVSVSGASTTARIGAGGGERKSGSSGLTPPTTVGVQNTPSRPAIANRSPTSPSSVLRARERPDVGLRVARVAHAQRRRAGGQRVEQARARRPRR